jgi:nucleotide-binding universal stress UspA family protein
MEGTRDVCFERVNRILVAVDDSESSRRAVEMASEMARALGAEMMLLHVIEIEELPTLIGEAEDMRADEEAQIVLGMAAKLAKGKGVEPKIAVRRGHPANQILRFADTYSPQLIVLGTRGVTGAKGVLMGSVSTAVSRKAHSSVVLVR